MKKLFRVMATLEVKAFFVSTEAEARFDGLRAVEKEQKNCLLGDWDSHHEPVDLTRLSPDDLAEDVHGLDEIVTVRVWAERVHDSAEAERLAAVVAEFSRRQLRFPGFS